MTVFVDLIKPKVWEGEVLAVVSGSLFLAIMSQLSIYLGFTPVPLSLQTLAVFLVGAYLGSNKGAAAVFFYLVQGACGLPVFTKMSGGLTALLGPTGGYLVGFVFAAYIVGYLVEQRHILLGLFVGNSIILFFGCLWLSFYVGVSRACDLGLYPFLIGDLLKIGIAALMIHSGKKIGSHLLR